MKLIRHGESGRERPGMVAADGTWRDLTGALPNGAEDLAGDMLADLSALANIDPSTLPEVDPATRLGPPVGGVGKMMCIGLNYADHAAETGATPPDEPILFMKATSAIVGPNDDVVLPRASTATDWEVELAVVIGRKAKHVAEADALGHVAGYTIANDVSERDYQIRRSGQWTKGKSCDTFGPLGPWLVTPDEVADPQSLSMWLDVNGDACQRGGTATMIFGVARIVSYLSDFFTLHPGDVIATGTPPGVGMGMKPPRYLKHGDEMRLGIEGLGEQRQMVRSAG